MPTDPATLDAFDALYNKAIVSGGAELCYELTAPLWQFLCYITDCKPVLLHGSGDPAIAVFEPRKSSDVHAFGDRKAVYAASDGLWPLYFAVLDRQRCPMTIVNSCTRVEPQGGPRSEPFYFFSITAAAREGRPYRRGTIYLLPHDTFEQQAPIRLPDRDIHVAQWASLVPVVPLARMSVTPEDFPLLDQIRGHDDEVVLARARENPDGFPWVDDQTSDSAG